MKNFFVLLFSFVAFFTFIEAANAFDPPIGIPDPGFGIDDVRPDRPVDWSNEIPGYYYINYETGTNTGRTYGKPSAPRKTFPSPLPAGSYVEVHGTYDSGATIIITGNGNSSSWSAGVSGPVWIVGETAETAPVFHRKVQAGGSYVYFDTIKIAPGISGALFQVSSATSGYPADHIVLRNSDIAGSVDHPAPGVSIGGADGTPASNVVIYNNIIHNLGDINAIYDQDSHATLIGLHASNIWVLENVIHTASGAGSQIGYNNQQYWYTTHHIYYGKNHVYNVRAAGLAAKGGYDIVLSENTLHDIIDCRTLFTLSASESKGVGLQYILKNVWVLYNHIFSANYGIRTVSSWGDIGGPSELYVIGNLIHDIEPTPDELVLTGVPYDPDNPWSGAAMSLSMFSKKVILNNTMHDVCAGVYFVAASTPYYVENNIISNITRNDTFHLLLNTGAVDDWSILFVRNNIFHQSGGGEKISPGDGQAYTVAQVLAAGHCTGCSAAYPLFIDPTNNLYRLSTGSPAIDAGLAPSELTDDGYGKYLADYALDITVDIDAKDRPYNSLWDIGAYEYSESALIIRADVDNSGGITTADALLTLRNSLGLEMNGTAWQVGAITGDVNCDSESNSADALLILRYSLGLDMENTAWCEQ